MKRKRLTEVFPWLLPLRKKQRKFCFYLKMRLDGQHYARTLSPAPLPFLLFETSCPMINRKTGFDLKYQENKVHNLKLAAKSLDGLLIRPGETFSFWQAARHADRDIPYREGLAEINGRLVPEYGGGLCMLSNLLFWALLHSPLTIAERHGHREKDFLEPPSDAPLGVDAAVAEGWLDLKMRNDTPVCYQLRLGFSEGRIRCRILAGREPGERFRVFNGAVEYRRERGAVFEYVPVRRERLALSGRILEEDMLYVNRCRIGYALPEGTEIEEEK